jgi:hypothetical protein
MGRPFAFRSPQQGQARFRQFGLCACCGEKLDNLEEHAHHVLPNQSGNPKNPDHAWLSSVDNCVVICTHCHERVHENGRYRNGAVAPPDYFRFSHGSNLAAHHAWVRQLNVRTSAVWR